MSNIAVVGAGLIGRKHVALVREHANLAAIVDPTAAAQAFADEIGARWFADLAGYLDVEKPDGAIIATPNQMHVENGLAFVDAGVPMLVEKPIADDVAAAGHLIEAAASANVPILVGHHRRYNPLVAAAKAAIDEGRLGNVVTVNAQFWLLKPDDYFEVEWRKKAGAGPVFINLIHDIDLLRHFCGEVVSVQAMDSSNARGNEVEDTAVILLEFANGALGTVSVSDCVVAPWSWELTAAENPAYPVAQTSCYKIGGRKASLSIPDMAIWRHPEKQGWWEPIAQEKLPFVAADPLVLQLHHFMEVIDGKADPLVSGQEGLETLRVVEAIKTAAMTGVSVRL